MSLGSISPVEPCSNQSSLLLLPFLFLNDPVWKSSPALSQQERKFPPLVPEQSLEANQDCEGKSPLFFDANESLASVSLFREHLCSILASQMAVNPAAFILSVFLLQCSHHKLVTTVPVNGGALQSISQDHLHLHRWRPC